MGLLDPLNLGALAGWATPSSDRAETADEPAAGGAAREEGEGRVDPFQAAFGNSVLAAALARSGAAPDPTTVQNFKTLEGLVGEQRVVEALDRGMLTAEGRPSQLRRSPEPGATDEPGLKAEKNPTDPTVPLPAPRAGNKQLAKGRMKWELRALGHSQAGVDIEFEPDATKVAARKISFLQTVLDVIGTKRSYPGATQADPVGRKAEHEPYEDPTSKKRIDHIVRNENDPFYGAEWDQSKQEWVRERADWQVGSTSGGTSTSAKMTDSPGYSGASPYREGKGDEKMSFETVPTVLETLEPLGALKWGYSIEDKENAPLVLEGGRDADCTDTPSADVAAAHEQFFKAKFEVILDDFDIDKANLKPAHKGLLDTVVTKMQGNASLRAQLGGAADLTGSAEHNMKLSLKRAQAAKTYLVSKGIDAARIEVQSYGFEWARVATEPGKSEAKNRRVQVWLH